MDKDIFTADFKQAPFWWEAVPRPKPLEEPLPKEADVVIVGSGYAGLNCALVVARAGRNTLVLEAEDPGYGASSRLAGFIGRFMYYSFPKLEATYGLERAKRMWKESGDAQRALLDFIEAEGMEADILWRGRFTAACSPEAYEALAKNAELIHKHVPFEFSMCPRSEQRKEIGTDYYHGGLILHEHGTLHPAKYHQALLDRVMAAGAKLSAFTPVRRIEPEREGFTVSTSRGEVQARDVVICTNGYTNTHWRAAPWVRRRIVPVPAHQIVTEPLGRELMKEVKPIGRALLDSKANIFWDRPTPDDARLIFGARTGHDDGDLKITARKLRALLITVYPQLENVKISHVWRGIMGFSFDKLPHIGRTRDGVYFATGFCGSGLPLGTHFGRKIGLRVLGDSEAETAFWNLSFPTWPFYNGTPWFLPLIIAWTDFNDRRGAGGHFTRAG